MLLLIALTASVAPLPGKVSGQSHDTPAELDTARATAVIDRLDIELSGMKNVHDLLLGRLDYNGFGIHRPFVLGTNYAAVLVNGRRISDSTFDLETLPLSAVERIEIFADGAVGRHGGHAIGGAVNIILKRDRKGFEIQASAGRPDRAGSDIEHGGVSWGGALGEGYMTIGVDFFHKQEVRDAKRKYSRSSWMPGGSFAGASGVSVGGNTVFISDNGDSIARALGDCRGSAYTGVLQNPLGISGTGCGFAWGEISWSQERLERENLFIDLDHPLGRDATLYAEARITQADAAIRWAPSVGTFSFTPTSELRQKLLQDPEIDTLPDMLRVSHRFVGHGNRTWRTDLEEYDITAGVRGKLIGNLNYDGYLRYYRHDAVVDGDTFVSERLVREAIDEGRYDLENPSSTAAQHRMAVHDTRLTLTRDVVTDHKAARLALDGTAFSLGDNDTRWMAGVEITEEDWRNVNDYRDVRGRHHDASDVLGSGGGATSGERRRRSAFAEISLPLLNGDWNIALSARHDDYDDVGAAFSHKAASHYRLNEALTFRGAWSEGARAPDLALLHTSPTISYPSVCDTRLFAGHLNDCDTYQVEGASGGNPHLRPAKSESANLGIVTDLGPLFVSVDWFEIKLSEVPARLSAQSIVDLEAAGRLPSGAAVIRAGNLITRIDNPWVNNARTDVSGLDVHARVDWRIDGLLDMVFDLRWSRVNRYEHRVLGEIQPGDLPRDRFHASLRAGRGGFTANWSIHSVSGYRNRLGTARYRPWLGHDVTLHWRNAFGFDGMEIAGGVLNIDDREPSTDPANPGKLGAAATLDSIRGRTLFLTAKIPFGS